MSFNEGFAYAFGNILAGTPLNIDTKGPDKAPIRSNLENPSCTNHGERNMPRRARKGRSTRPR